MKLTVKKHEGKWGIFSDNGLLTGGFNTRNQARNAMAGMQAENETPPEPAGVCSGCGQESNTLTYDHIDSKLCPACADATPTPADPMEAHPTPGAPTEPPKTGYLLRINGDANGWLEGYEDGSFAIVPRKEATVYDTFEAALNTLPVAAAGMDGVSLEVVDTETPVTKTYLIRMKTTDGSGDDQWVRRSQSHKSADPAKFTIVPRHRAIVFTRLKSVQRNLKEATKRMPALNFEIVEQGV